MPCQYQYELIDRVRDTMDMVLDDTNEFTKDQLVDLINHWQYSLYCVVIYDYYIRDHNKRYFRRMKQVSKLAKEGKIDEALRLQNSPLDREDKS